MEDSLFLFLGGLGDPYTTYTRENPPTEIYESGVYKFDRVFW